MTRWRILSCGWQFVSNSGGLLMHQTSPASPLLSPIYFAVLPTPSECDCRRLGLFTASVRQLIVCAPQLYFSRHLNLVDLEICGLLGMFSSRFSFNLYVSDLTLSLPWFVLLFVLNCGSYRLMSLSSVCVGRWWGIKSICNPAFADGLSKAAISLVDFVLNHLLHRGDWRWS